MTNEKRTYKMKRRAKAEEETRQRITESTVELHEALGPSRTSISAIAEHAGVRRSTVYRHFPDEAALFHACTTHWMAANPLPDLSAWMAIEDVEHRLDVAVSDIYAYYRRAQKMMSNIHRDEEIMPLVKHMMGGYRDYLEGARQALIEGRAVGSGARALMAMLGHVLAFYTWRSLALDQGLNDEEAAVLMARLVRCAQMSEGP